MKSSRLIEFLSVFFGAVLCFLSGAKEVLAQSRPSAPIPPGASPAPERETRGEKLELLRDGSVEESLSRKIDVGFGSVRIDGEKSSVPLSSLTADQVLAAETTKVPTPDLDADAVGGLLQLTSRRAFDQRAPIFRASVGAGYDALTDKFSPEGSVTYGRAIGKEARFGFVVTGSGSREFRHGEEIDMDWDSSASGGLLEEATFGEEDSTSREFALNGLVDWKLGEKSAVQFRVNFSSESEKAVERNVAYRLNNRRQPATSTTEVERSLGEEEQRATAFTFATGIAHRSARWELDVRLSHTREVNKTPDERSHEFRQDGVGMDYAVNDPRFPQIAPRAAARPDDPALFFLDELQLGRQEEREDDSVASFDLKLPELGGWKTAWVKVGTKFRALRTDRVESNDVYRATGGGIRLSEVLGPARNDRFMQGRYTLHAFPDATALRRLFATAPGRFALDVDATRSDTDAANYEVRQDVLANYAMGSVALGRHTRILGGVRMERTSNRFTGNEVVFGADGHYEATNRVTATGASRGACDPRAEQKGECVRFVDQVGPPARLRPAGTGAAG